METDKNSTSRGRRADTNGESEATVREKTGNRGALASLAGGQRLHQ